MAEDFSDISNGEVVCATQLVEELYGDDATDADLLVASQQNKILLLFSFRASDTFAGISFCAFLFTNLLGTISIILMQAGSKFDGSLFNFAFFSATCNKLS